MGLKETYEGKINDARQQELRRIKSDFLKAQRDEHFKRLCEPLPCLLKMYQERQGRDKTYEEVYNFTLASQVSPEIQNVINEFIQICPIHAWNFSYSGWGKYRLADESIHIVKEAGPENQIFQFGSQYCLSLPYSYYYEGKEDCYGETIWYGSEILIFQDGFVKDANSSGPLFLGEKRFTDFCAEQLVCFKKHGEFGRMSVRCG